MLFPLSLPLETPSAMFVMEPPAAVAPPLSATTATLPPPPPPQLPYPESVDSSPRSRATETWDGAADPLPPVPGGAKLRLMCSYGGHIVPRPHDKSLCYVGGDTRIVVVDRNCTLPELLQRLSKILLNDRPFTLKYQLPSEDLDSLITVTSEEDLDNMVEEYDRLINSSSAAKSFRIRLFLFPTKLEVAASMGPIMEGSNKSDDWFLSALNGAGMLQRGFSDPPSVNCLLGLDENVSNSRNLDPNSKQVEAHAVAQLGNRGMANGLGGGRGELGNQSNQDVHSVPDSPIVGTTSSFGSTSSSLSLASLPPIRVHAENGGGPRVLDQKIGAEEQFAQMGVSDHKHEEGLVMMSSPPTNLVVPTVVGGEYVNRIISDDERSDHSLPGGYWRPPQPAPPPLMVPQPQLKQMDSDLPSPDSVSSDSSLSNAITRQRQMMYQDPSGYALPHQYDQQQHQAIQQHQQQQQAIQQHQQQAIQKLQAIQQQQHQAIHQANQQQQATQIQQHQQQAIQQQQQQQANQQQQAIQQQQQAIQQQQQQQETQPQQFVHGGAHYAQHHPAGTVPVSYYPVYPHPHQVDQRYQMYYLPVQQQNVGETVNAVPSSQPQTPPNPGNKDERAHAGVYRLQTAGTQQLVQAPSHQNPPQQQQQVMYSQVYYPPQSMAPTAGYEYSDPAQAQIYFTQPLGAPQYQTMAVAPPMSVSDAPPSADSIKAQQRTTQPL